MAKSSDGRRSARPKGASAGSGKALERRVARMYFWSGLFSRASIDLRQHFHPEPLLLTDLDLVAYDISTVFAVERVIGESKSGTAKSAPKPLDRVFWLSGLMKFTGAQGGVLTVTSQVSRQVRDIAAKLSIRIMTEQELARLEQERGLSSLDYGSFSGDLDDLWDRLRPLTRSEPSLERAYKFLRSEVWHLDPWLATKRTIALMSAVRKQWVEGLAPDELLLVRTLLVEATVVFSLAAIRIAGEIAWLPSDQAHQLILERLSEGAAPMRELVRLSQAVDTYIAGLLHEVNAPSHVQVKAMGAFYPRPPDYAEAFEELVRRLAASPKHVRHLPRLFDVALYENIVRNRVVERAPIEALELSDIDKAHRAARLITAFLSGQIGIPAELFIGLGFAIEAAPIESERQAAVSHVPTLAAKAVPGATDGEHQLPGMTTGVSSSQVEREES